MIAMFWLLAALNAPAGAAPASAAPDIDRMAISHVVTHRDASAHLDAIIQHGQYALASGRSSTGMFYQGLQLHHSGWRVVCTFKSPPSSEDLSSDCGFPSGIAAETASNQSAESAAEQGDFQRAVTAEKKAWMSAKAPDAPSERARVQYLTMLNEQMRTGMITRQQGIQKWGDFRYSWTLP